MRYPDYITNKISYYIWKNNTHEINKEYHDKYHCDITGGKIIILRWMKMFNYRNSKGMFDGLIHDLNCKTTGILPKNYFYTSGFNYPYGYKMEM